MMFTIKQLVVLMKWVNDLGVFEEFSGIFASSRDVVIGGDKDVTLTDQRECDPGLIWPLLMGICEYIIPKVVNLNHGESTAINHQEFTHFLQNIAEQLLTASIATQATLEVLQNSRKLDDHLTQLIAWQKSLVDLFKNIVQLAEAYSDGKVTRELIDTYNQVFANFKACKTRLASLPENVFASMSTIVFSQVEPEQQELFARVDEAQERLGRVIQSSRAIRGDTVSDVSSSVASAAEPTSRVFVTTTAAKKPPHKVGEVECFSAVRQQTYASVPSHTGVATSTEAQGERGAIQTILDGLERNFSRLQYRQYVLTGHNVFLGGASVFPYTEQVQRYAGNISALLLAEQTVVAQTYDDLRVAMPEVVGELYREFNRADGFKVELQQIFEAAESNGLLEAAQAVMQQETAVAEDGSVPYTSVDGLIGKTAKGKVSRLVGDILCRELAKKLSVSYPQISELVVVLNKHGGAGVTGKLNELLTSQLDGVLQGSKLPPALKQLGAKFLTRQLQQLTSSDWVGKLEGAIDGNIAKLGALLDGLAEKGVSGVFRALTSSGLDFAKLGNIFSNLEKGDVSGLWKSVTGNGLGAGTFADSVGGNIMSLAVNHFLPVVTREIFGDSKTGMVASSTLGYAMTGFSAGGPIGACIGGAVGLFSSLFGGSDSGAASADAQRQTLQVMQKLVTTAVENINTYTGKCFERFDARMSGRFDRVDYGLQKISRDMVFMSEDLHDHMDVLGYQISDGFAVVCSQFTRLARDLKDSFEDVHLHMEHLGQHMDDRFDHVEEVVQSGIKFLCEGIRGVRDLSNARFDRLDSILAREFLDMHKHLEYQYLRQQKFLESLYTSQTEEHERLYAHMSDASKKVCRMIDSLNRCSREQHLEIMQRLAKTITLFDIFRREDRLDATSDGITEIDPSKKSLLLRRIAQTGEQAIDRHQWADLWLSTVRTYLHLLYRCPGLWNSLEICIATQNLIDHGVIYQRVLFNKPNEVAQCLFTYQQIVYEEYHKIMRAFVAQLCDKHLLQPRNEEPFAEWRTMRDRDDTYRDFDYELGTYVARLGRHAVGCRLLDVVTSENGVLFYAEERGQIVVRRFALEKVSDKLDRAKVDSQRLFSYPAIVAGYQEISILLPGSITSPDSSGYAAFYNKWRSEDGVVGKTSAGYLLKYCPKTKLLYIWQHNQDGHAGYSIDLTQQSRSLGKEIKVFDAVVDKDGKLVVALVFEGGDIQISKWDITSGEKLGEHDYPTLRGAVPLPAATTGESRLARFNFGAAFIGKKITTTTRMSTISSSIPELLTIHGNGYLLCNRFLIDSVTLQLRVYTAALGKDSCFYSSDEDHVRLIIDPVGQETEGGELVYDLTRATLTPMTSPLVRESFLNKDVWLFRSDRLEMVWPFNFTLLCESTLPNQRYLADYNGYAVYFSLQDATILLIKKFTPEQQDRMNKIRQNSLEELWNKFCESPVIQKWQSTLQQRLDTMIPGGQKKLAEDLQFILVNAIKKHPAMITQLNQLFSIVNFFARQIDVRGLTRKVVPSYQQFVANILHFNESCLSLQGLLATVYLEGTPYPVVTRSIIALNHAMVLQGKQPTVAETKFCSDKKLLQAHVNLLGIGIKPKLEIADGADGTKQLSLYFSILKSQQTWEGFFKSDLLFFSRFTGRSHHETLVYEFLKALQTALDDIQRTSGLHGMAVKPLSEQFTRQPGSGICLFQCPANIVVEVCQKLQEKISITLVNSEPGNSSVPLESVLFGLSPADRQALPRGCSIM